MNQPTVPDSFRDAAQISPQEVQLITAQVERQVAALETATRTTPELLKETVQPVRKP